MNLAERLKKARELAGLSQRELAARCRARGHAISAGQIGKIEVGERTNPRASDIDTIALATGVSHRWLLLGEGDMVETAPTVEEVSAFDGALGWFVATEEHEGRGDDVRRFLAQRDQVNAGTAKLSPDAWLAKLRDEFRAWRRPDKALGVTEIGEDEPVKVSKIPARRR